MQRSTDVLAPVLNVVMWWIVGLLGYFLMMLAYLMKASSSSILTVYILTWYIGEVSGLSDAPSWLIRVFCQTRTFSWFYCVTAIWLCSRWECVVLLMGYSGPIELFTKFTVCAEKYLFSFYLLKRRMKVEDCLYQVHKRGVPVHNYGHCFHNLARISPFCPYKSNVLTPKKEQKLIVLPNTS